MTLKFKRIQTNYTVQLVFVANMYFYVTRNFYYRLCGPKISFNAENGPQGKKD